MTRDEAIELAKRVAKSWRGGPAYAEWCDYLIGFDDIERATTALDRLREVEPLTFKKFGDKYRELAHAATPTPVRHLEPVAPRLTREQIVAALIAGGAPRRLIGKHQEAL